MNNITIVSMDNEQTKNIAQRLAATLNFVYIDASLELEKLLLTDFRSSMFNSDTPAKETKLISYLAKQNNSVLAIDNEMFLSNENYKQFKKSVTLLIEIKNDNEIAFNLQDLLKKYCKFSTTETKIEKILTLLKG